MSKNTPRKRAAHEIFTIREMVELLEAFLIEDDEFIADLDNVENFGEKLKDMNPRDRIIYLRSYVIGNGARTYILNIAILKHLKKFMIEENKNFLDVYWQDKAKHLLEEEGDK